MRFLDTARQLKHWMFIADRRMRRIGAGVADPLFAQVAAARGFAYDPERYVMRGGPHGTQVMSTGSTFPLDHLRFETTLPTQNAAATPRRLFLLWPGDNEMTGNRRTTVERIRQQASHGVDVELITPRGLQDIEVSDMPLHPAYRQLSAVHRSDYLRAYLMYHHGGAYLDIKPFRTDLASAFDRLDAQPDVWAIGAPETPVNTRHLTGGPLARATRRNVTLTLSQAAVAFRPHTPLAAEWLEEVNRRLDYFSGLLEASPARTPYGDHDDYPVPWFALLSSVLAPLCLKHQEHVVTDAGFATWANSGYSSYR